MSLLKKIEVKAKPEKASKDHSDWNPAMIDSKFEGYFIQIK